MHVPKKYLLLIVAALGPMICCSYVKKEAEMVSNQATADGGCCTYISYEGSAQIMRVSQTPASVTQYKILGGPGYEGYEVWFRFTTQQNIPHGVRKEISREQLFTLKNSWYVGPRYLEKYGIETGKAYPCKLKVIKEGTCTPIVFEFDAIDSGDYFESRP
jgi:hypothetical protein